MIRKEGLTIGQALRELVGLRKLEHKKWPIYFAAATVVSTLALWVWLSADCRAALA